MTEFKPLKFEDFINLKVKETHDLMDAVQIMFSNDWILTINNEFKVEHGQFHDLLGSTVIRLIGKEIVEFIFDNNKLTIDLTDNGYRDSPEAMILYRGDEIMIWG